MSSTEQLLNLLEEHANLLRKTQVNLKKCPKQRLTKGYIEGRLKCVEEYWQTFKDNHQKLITITPKEKRMELQYFLNEDFYTVEELYICLQGDLKDMITTPNQLHPVEASEAVQPLVKLPRIQLPTFGGRYEEWPTFQDLFVSLVDNNTSLSKVQKLQYLKLSVNGEAEFLLKNVSVTETNYQLAWQILKHRYGNKRLIVNSLLNRLFGIRKVSAQTANQIKILLDTTSECLSSLENLQISTKSWDPVIIYLIVQKLDYDTHKAWEEHIYNNDSDVLPTWGDLKAFLESKFRTLELITASATTSREVRNPPRDKSFYTSSQLPTKVCLMCKDDHALYHCKEFTRLQPDERNEFVKSNDLCYNCLNSGHSVFKCRSRTQCRLCNRRHHTLLHSDKNNNRTENLPTNHNQIQEEQEIDLDDSNNEAAIASHFTTKKSTALLATALIPVNDNSGHITYLRALIDQGSQANFISERASQLLNVLKIPVKGTVTGVGSTQTDVNYMVNLNLLSRHDSNYKLSIQAYVIPTRLTTQLPTQTIASSKQTWLHIHALPLADPKFYQPGRVDMLLGVEVYAQILKQEIIKGPPGTPCAQNTSFGWILFGNVENIAPSTNLITMHHTVEIDDFIRAMWELEEKGDKLTKEEERCERIYTETYKRNKEGRYIVKLPFKITNPKSVEGDTRRIAKERFLQLEKRFKRDSKLKEEYQRVMEEYLSSKHMERVPVEEINNPSVYLSHHAVIKETSNTSRVRIVFNASSPGINGVSLNDELLVGPQLQDDMRSIVMRWRLKKIGFVADIEKWYRQILVTKNDADYQRVLWRSNEVDPIQDFRLLRVTFGTASAPYLAVKTLHQVTKDEGESYPIASETIKQDFFMDDLMSGSDTIEEALITAKQITEILNNAKFKLQKWSSNSLKFMENFKQKDRNALVEIDMKLDSTVRTLGISWDTEKDLLKYNNRFFDQDMSLKVITKRRILSEIQKLFDPLGWLAPALVPAKMLIQELWLQGISWDKEVDSETKKKWLEIRSSFEHVNDIHLNRWLNTYSTNMKDVSIHGYCDASLKAYGAVAYLRVVTKEGTIKTSIIAAKTRAAPVKPVSLPRLELCGAVLLSQLLKQISKALNMPINQIYAWTDSTIVLAWLEGDPVKWQTFVKNRVVTILDNIGNNWFHVKSHENPADLASRGLLLNELKNNNLWWNGPEYLKRKNMPFNKPSNLDTDQEKRNNILVNLKLKETVSVIPFEEYDSLSQLLRVVTFCRRFLKYKSFTSPISIKVDELNESFEKCISIAQDLDFKDEIIDLKKGKILNKGSKIRNLNPYLDDKHILRVGGRLRNAPMDLDRKNPVLLGQKSGLSSLIVEDAHKKTLHGGVQLMMNYIRSRFWIVKLKSQVTGHLRRCVICARQRATSRTQMMGDLPEVRVTPARPFLHAGVDFAGPMTILTRRGRGAKCEKAYICIFICMATKAIHLELVGNLSSEAFLGAFRRFVSRRGKCTHLWSDQGTNFVGGNKELCNLYREANLDLPQDLKNLLVDEGTEWHFNPPYSPNFGGLWEAGVKSVKYHLKRILNTNLTFEELSTMLCQIEACLNSRPLCPISNTDPENVRALTPGHFLIGEAPIVIPEPSLLHVNVNRLSRWQHTQKLVQDFWKRWQTEYLSRLQQRPKWLNQKKEFQIGDVVLVKDDNLPPGKWALGRILVKHPGHDNICRVYSLRCNGKIIKRSISKLCELPVNDDN